MAIIIAKIDVNWADAFQGYVPSKYIFQSGGLYTCNMFHVCFICVILIFEIAIGILGATVMPHSLFLGSALSTQDRMSPSPGKIHPQKMEAHDDDLDSNNIVPASRLKRLWISTKEYLRVTFTLSFSDPHGIRPRRHSDRENNSLAFVKAHLYHGIVDIVSSLLGFAVIINSL
jgi:metal iron transporter